jgi:hypothetical protein
MAKLYDEQGNRIDNLHRLGGETIVDARNNTTILAAINAEVLFDVDVQAMASVDFRGTFVLQAIAEATIDGTNYFQIPIWNILTEAHIVSISAAGSYQVNIPSGSKKIRVRCSSYTSGSATVAMRGSVIDTFLYAKDLPATTATVTAAVGIVATLTIPAAGVGLYNYLVALYVEKFAGAVLTAAATPVLVPITGLLGNPILSFSASADAVGTSVPKEIVSSKPIKGSATNTTLVVSCPAVTGVIWRVNAVYYVGA